jgi:diamine N-acetyltransferase
MEVISMREVTRDNWRQALRLAVHPYQQRFVADEGPIAAIALAKAYIRPGGLIWTPYAFYANEDMVGFAALACEPGGAEACWIFHFFIDRERQARGYGKRALELLVRFVKDRHAQCRAIQLTVHPENHRAHHLYTRVGFLPTGEALEGEPVYRLGLGQAAA